MTAKELLHRRIDEMSDDEAAFYLEWLEAERSEEFPPLTPDDLARIERALEQERQGHVVSHQEVLRRLGRL